MSNERDLNEEATLELHSSQPPIEIENLESKYSNEEKEENVSTNINNENHNTIKQNQQEETEDDSNVADIAEEVSCPPPPSCDHSQYELEISRLKKELELSIKAKETTVMRYANSEKEVIRRDKELENVNKQLKNHTREIDVLTKKNKTLATERERLAFMIDTKNCENQVLQKELDKIKEDNSQKDFKLKWTQSKLNGEIEARKVTTAKLEKCEQDLQKALREASRMREDCREMIASCSPEPNYTVAAPSNQNYEYIPSSDELPETEGDNLLQASTTSNSTSGGQRSPASESFLREIETLKLKHKALIDENNSLSCKVQVLEENRLDNQQKIIRLKESNAEHLHQIASLHTDLGTAETWKVQLEKEQERILSIQAECDQLRQCNSELLTDMAICREKEAELLAYTQQVTGKNVQLQSEFSAVEARSNVLADENIRLQNTIEKLEDEAKAFEKVISQEKRMWNEKREELLSNLEQKNKIIEEIQGSLDEAKGELVLMKKKHESTLKEMRKEVESLRKQCKDMNGDGLSSRTSSSTSLNQSQHENSQKSPDSHPNSNGDNYSLTEVPDQQHLIEKIVKLQRSLAKKQEKIEFLQEHSRKLLENVQSKSKIIQVYAMQNQRALSTEISPRHKSELMKQGGLPSPDEPMTVEEINRKLQAVLEDALLKNITLKESMRTLGSEISRLTQVNKELSEKKKDKPG